MLKINNYICENDLNSGDLKINISKMFSRGIEMGHELD